MTRTRRLRKQVDQSTPTINQVAEQAGVSIATVSRVLTGADGVSPGLSGRVLKVVSELNYQPNRNARNLRSRSTRLVGLVIPDIQNPFFTSVVRGIEDVLQADDYTLLLGNSDDNLKREQIYLATLRVEAAAGIIFAAGKATASDYEQMLKARIPLVALDRTPYDLPVDNVTVANTDGAEQAVTHLISLGHKRIAMINGPANVTTARDRQAGYERALAAAKIAVRANLIQHADFRQTGGYEAMRRLLDLAKPPTAVFVANNLMTLGALQEIHERSLRIPDDIAVVGFDDMPWATALQPPLTAVAQPTYELGATAAQLLLARIKEPERSVRRITLDTKLMIRASCGANRTS